MHPLAAIGLVILMGPAWLGTIVTLLVVLAKSRRPPAAEARSPQRPPVEVRGDSRL